jgi:hypothetical protein
MLLIISRYAGVFLRNTLKPSVLSLTECHSCQEPIVGTLMQESRFSVPDTFFFPHSERFSLASLTGSPQRRIHGLQIIGVLPSRAAAAVRSLVA